MFVNIENVPIFASGLSNGLGVFNVGEILKRPTRADCKSAVQTSQVRILLSPQKSLKLFSGFFMSFNFNALFLFTNERY
jgi:hypothetical protein